MAESRPDRDTVPDPKVWEADTLPGKPAVAICGSCGALCKPPESGTVAFCDECLAQSDLKDFPEGYVTLGGFD